MLDERVLYLKHRLVGTVLAPALTKAQLLVPRAKHIRHPELREMDAEAGYFDPVFNRLVQPTSNCLDVGCHIGSVLHEFHRRAPLGSHAAIEAVPTKAQWLRARYTSVDIHNVAVSDTPGEAHFVVNARSSGSSYLAVGPVPQVGPGETVIPVRMETLDVLFADRTFDVIKMDIEGAELSALRGATSLFARSRCPLIFECGPEAGLAPFGYTRADLFDFLTGTLGYDVRSLKGAATGEQSLTRNEFVTRGQYPFRGFNYVATPPGFAF